MTKRSHDVRTRLMLWSLAAVWPYAQALAAELELTPAQLSSLGVEWARPNRGQEIAIASGPAEVVVPPTREIVVSTQIAGLITRLLVAEGATVTAGQPLLEIMSPGLLDLERGYLDALAEAALTAAQLDRDRALMTDGIIAERRLNETIKAAEMAGIRVSQSRQQLILAGMDTTELAELERSRALDATLTLRAPMSGTLVAQNLSLGEKVEPYEPVTRIADLTVLWLDLDLPQERVDAVASGMSVQVDVRGRQLNAEIVLIGSTVQPTTQTVLVRAEIDNADGLLRSGQVLDARIVDLQSERNSTLLPASAIVRTDGRTHVFVRTPSGVTMVPVEVLGASGATVYVNANDLDRDAEVAINGVSALKSALLGETAGED